MRPDCTVQQLARGYISFSHLQQKGKEERCNNPLKPANTSPLLAFGQSRPFTSSLHPTNPRRTGQGEMAMRQAK